MRGYNGTIAPRTDADAEVCQWSLDWFLEEARILAQCDHRHIVRVYRMFEARARPIRV